MAQLTQNEERAIAMLGSGVPQAQVAMALGVTESAVSQWMSQEEFSRQVSDLKFKNLSRHTAIDDRYTSLEEKLQDKLEKVLPLMSKPRDIVTALTAINNTKRRGAQSVEHSSQHSTIINLSLPTQIVQKYISNSNNQIVEVLDGTGQSKSLVTASSSSLDRLSEEILGIPEDNKFLTGGAVGQEESKHAASQELLKQLSAKVLSERSGEIRRIEKGATGQVTVQDL